MTKNEFLSELEKNLKGLGKADIERSLEYYSEMLDDRIENGEAEADAVAAMGTPEDAARAAMMDMPLAKIVKAKALGNRHLHTWEIVLLVLGSPLWLPLLLAALAVFVSLYIVIWAITVSIWAVGVSLAAAALTGVVMCGVLMGAGNIAMGLLFLGTGLMSGGLCLFVFLGCRELTKLAIKLGALILKGTKALFVGKGDRKA